MVHPVERLRGRAVPVVVGPATNDRVQQTDQHGLADGLVRVNQFPDFLQKHVRVFLRRFHQRLAVVFAEVLSEEVEPFVDMRDAVLSGESCKPRSRKNCSTKGLDFIFQQFLGSRR